MKTTKLQSSKVTVNKYRNEYIDYEVKQIKKERDLMQRISEQEKQGVLPKLIEKLSKHKNSSGYRDMNLVLPSFGVEKLPKPA